ncbi:MAG: anti-sigma factor [Gemmatimonadales bacterium]
MSRPEQDSPQDLAPAYALGMLPPEESRRFESFLATSPEAQREVAEFRDVSALLALGGGEGPHSGLRARVLERVRKDQGRPLPVAAGSSRRPAAALWIAMAASLLAAVGLGAGLLSLRREVGQLEAIVSQQRSTLAQRERDLASREATLNRIFGPGVQMFQLTGRGDPRPRIQLFWDRQHNQAIVHGFQLEPVPPGRAYQLWFIRNGKPVPSITFRPEPDGHVKVEQVAVPADGSVSAAAVTMEPESGSAQPTLPLLLAGELQKS